MKTAIHLFSTAALLKTLDDPETSEALAEQVQDELDRREFSGHVYVGGDAVRYPQEPS